METKQKEQDSNKKKKLDKKILSQLVDEKDKALKTNQIIRK